MPLYSKLMISICHNSYAKKISHKPFKKIVNLRIMVHSVSISEDVMYIFSESGKDNKH